MSMLTKMAAAGASAPKLYVDDVFSAYTYTGNAATQNIANGIDMAGKGGLVWIKNRTNPSNHVLFDTARISNSPALRANTTEAQQFYTPNGVTAYLSNGFTVASPPSGTPNTDLGNVNHNYISWTFRKAAKFFDVITWTGDGGVNQRVGHSLGSVPGLIIAKVVSTNDDWFVYHRSLSRDDSLRLNTTGVASTFTNTWGAADPTSTDFGANGNIWCQTGKTYVAYLFAHDNSTDGLIQCGSFTTDGSGNATANLGWEPQFALVKGISVADEWWMWDTAREWTVDAAKRLMANSTAAESASITAYKLTNQGFSITGAGAARTYIYMAIRRPNKPPTSGAQVFHAALTSASDVRISTGFPVDVLLGKSRTGNAGGVDAVGNTGLSTRLTGFAAYWSSGNKQLHPHNTIMESNVYEYAYNVDNNGYVSGYNPNEGGTRKDSVVYSLRRAPGFMDVVCWTQTVPGNPYQAQSVTHGLGVVPELVISKSRSASTDNWYVTGSALGTGQRMYLNLITGKAASGAANHLANTATTYYAPCDQAAGATHVSYLFASLSGISKIGSYTGNGSSQIINCGFTGGARFILIKRADSAGDWYIWNSASGIVAGNDHYLYLNRTYPEVSTDDSVDPAASGFAVNQLASTNINVTAATYIFLAIA